MKAIKYIVDVVEVSLEVMDGMRYPIVEFYIPEKKIAFNYKDNDLHVFYTKDEERLKRGYKKKEIEISGLLCVMLENFIGLKDEVMGMIKEEKSLNADR